MSRIGLCCLSAFLVFALPACGERGQGGGATAQAVLRWTAIPDQDATRLRQKFEPVSAYLGRTLGVSVEYVPVKDYAASVEGFKNGELHMAWFGGLTGVQARHAVKGAHAIAQGVEDPRFYSYFVAHKDTGLERSESFPAGVAGRSFTFGSEQSTSGRLMPEFFLREATGKAPSELFKSVAFSGDHDKTAEIVGAGSVEVGVLNYQVYDRRVAEGKTDPDVCRVIWKTPEFADYNITAHPALETLFGAGFTQRLQQALVDMQDPALLSGFGRKALIPARDEEFDGIRKVAEALGFLD